MNSFESKWGNIPDEVSVKKNVCMILVTQFLVTIFILFSLQPPFVTVSKDDDYSHPQLSITLVLLVSLVCVSTAFFMNKTIDEILKIHKNSVSK